MFCPHLSLGVENDNEQVPLAHAECNYQKKRKGWRPARRADFTLTSLTKKLCLRGSRK